MVAKLFPTILCLAVFVLPLCGCGGAGDMTPEGPELGDLERYMNEHPELMDDNSDDEDQEGEFEMGDGEEAAPETPAPETPAPADTESPE